MHQLANDRGEAQRQKFFFSFFYKRERENAVRGQIVASFSLLLQEIMCWCFSWDDRMLFRLCRFTCWANCFDTGRARNRALFACKCTRVGAKFLCVLLRNQTGFWLKWVVESGFSGPRSTRRGRLPQKSAISTFFTPWNKSGFCAFRPVFSLSLVQKWKTNFCRWSSPLSLAS